MLRDRPQGVVSEEVALTIWEKIHTGLEHVHSCGIIHRDMHCGNVLVKHAAPSQTTLLPAMLQSVKIADFGKATMRQSFAVPMYTAKTCVLSAIAPEVMFRNGTLWKTSHKRSAGSQIENHAITSAPRCCKYTEKIDSWASGILLIQMAKGMPYDGVEAHEFAKGMINIFGKVPAAVAREHQWSVPDGWKSVGGFSDAAPSQKPRHPMLVFASGSLLWQEKVDRALKVLSYDPKERQSRF
jgi:serine/threonine protein kinase